MCYEFAIEKKCWDLNIQPGIHHVLPYLILNKYLNFKINETYLSS